MCAIDLQAKGRQSSASIFPIVPSATCRTPVLMKCGMAPGAQRYREYKRLILLSVCCRCGADSMAEVAGQRF